MESKIGDRRLQKMLESPNQEDKVSIILQLKESTPTVRINKNFRDQKKIIEKYFVSEESKYQDNMETLKQNLFSLGITSFRSLDSIKAVIVDEATLGQIKTITLFPEVSQIFLNREHHK